MTTLILPTIGSSGYFRLKAPLSTLIIENEVYTCRAIRTLNDYLANNEDPLTDIYKNYGLSDAEYQTDLTNNTSIVSLQSDSGHWLYIPARYIDSYPLTNGIPYRTVMIGISLPSLPVDKDISYVGTDLTNLIKDRLGVTPVIKQVETSRPVLVDKETHDKLTAERALVAKVGETDSSRYQKLLVDFNRALRKITMLEKYITSTYIKSIDYDPLTNNKPSGTFTIGGNAFNGNTITAYPALYDIEGVGVLHYQWYSGADKVGTDDRFYTTQESDIDKEITCIVSYTDGFGNEEQVKSSNGIRIKSKVNRGVTGKLEITGEALVDHTVTLIDTLVDPDGIDSINYTWKYTTATSTTYDGVEAPASMNSLSYIISQDIPAGSVLYVEAKVTDNSGHVETVYSNKVPLADLSNRVFAKGEYWVGKTLTASNTITDIHHGLQYFWYYDDANGIPVELAANTATYTLAPTDIGKEVYAKAVYVTRSGITNVINSEKHAINKTTQTQNQNNAVGGLVIISGDKLVGSVLTATNTLTDSDGLGAFTYKWKSGPDIVGGNNDTYKTSISDIGKMVTCTISYQDAKGNREVKTSNGITVTSVSAPTFTNNAPTGTLKITGHSDIGSTLTATNTIADKDGLGELTYQWYSGTTPVGSKSLYYTTTRSDLHKDITFTITYTDERGTVETVTSNAIMVTSPDNTLPVGTVTISGNTVVDSTLTADITTLADVDGLGPFHYQWYSDNDKVGTDTNTYVLAKSDIGKVISCVINYIDNEGHSESVTSNSTTPILTSNRPTTGAVFIAGNTAAGSLLIVDVSALADADGLGTFTYQWKTDSVNTVNTTTYTTVVGDVGKTITCEISYTDGKGYNEVIITKPLTVTKELNNLPTGAVAITGNAASGSILTADITTLADVDGLGPFNYQWKADNVDIAGATSSTYTSVTGDVGKVISCTVTYTDGKGTVESVTSNNTITVAAPTPSGPTGVPVIVGNAQVGQILTCDVSQVTAQSNAGPITLYRWFNDSNTTIGSNNPGYIVQASDLGSHIHCEITYTWNGTPIVQGAAPSAAVTPYTPIV